jgi:hypothetical protein
VKLLVDVEAAAREEPMAKDSLSGLPLWDRFQKAAREQGRSPLRLLTRYMREYLAVWEDQQFDQEIRRDVQANGYSEEDAVEIVRRYRREKRERRAAS